MRVTLGVTLFYIRVTLYVTLAVYAER